MPEENRRDFSLYIDEFQNFTTTSFANILAEARKYRLCLVMAHQFMSQIPDFLQDAVIGTANTTIAFRVGARDAPLLASELGLDNPKALKDLANFEAWVKTIENGQPGNPKLIKTLPPVVALGRLGAVRNRTHARYARPRERIEQEIARFMGEK
jgi:DNA helicase HerA-like ATPase